MSPTFVLMVAPWAKLFRIPIITWYAHHKIDWKLKIAHFLSDKIITPSKDSFRIKSDKVSITGHGINTHIFRPVNNQYSKNKIIILSVGRISPIKNYETLIKAADIMINKEGIKDLEFVIVGGSPFRSQEIYHKRLIEKIGELDLNNYIKFKGSVPYIDILKHYQQCDIHINLCQTGGLDKAVLEAMACAKPVILCNENFKDLLEPHSHICLFKFEDPNILAEKLKKFIKNEEIREKIGKNNRKKVIAKHSISNLAKSLINIVKSKI